MPAPLHEVVRGFDRAAAAYERGRPEYPPEAIGLLTRVLELGPGRTVLDLGAGTGKLTRALLPTGARLLALEPTAGMRAELTRRLPEVPLVEGTAEAIDRPAESLDAVVCAQAFHWFDVPRATAEVARVLRPGGGLALLWNLRDDSVPWVRELTRLIDARDPGVPRGRSHAWREPFEATGRFTPLEYAELRFVQPMDGPTLADRVLSISFIALLSTTEQEVVAREVEALLHRHPEAVAGDRVDLPYRTEVYWAFRR